MSVGRGYVRYRPERIADRATEAQVQAMNAKLAARAKQIPFSAFSVSHASNAAQSPKEKADLKWEKVVPGAVSRKTECGRYCCSTVTTEGKTTYELWKANPSPGASPIVRMHHGLDNFLQAQELARQDWEKSA